MLRGSRGINTIVQRSRARDHVNIVAVSSGRGEGGEEKGGGGRSMGCGWRRAGHQEMRTGGGEKLTRRKAGGGAGGGGVAFSKLKVVAY